jgi:ppGpp synthetase/RelA/SpoT-type nucleotidyltranferase
MAIPQRGLREIRTNAGKQDQTYRPYRAYMQITCLEMEKARRHSERKTSLQRIHSLDARLKEIEAEKGTLLRKLEKQRTGDDGRPASVSSRDLTHCPRGSAAGFRLRY